jgi:hypothetical protein
MRTRILKSPPPDGAAVRGNRLTKAVVLGNLLLRGLYPHALRFVRLLFLLLLCCEFLITQRFAPLVGRLA